MTRATLPLITTTFSVTDIAVQNGEPRVLDTLLAERLGMVQPLNIRASVKANLAELSMHGEVFTVRVKTTAKGGRPGTAYYLNEPQVLLLCMFANTPKAAQIRKSVIDAFMEYRRGKAPTTSAVRAHERRTSTKVDKAITLARSIDRLEKIAATLIPQPVIPNLCAMVVEGVPVFVDTTAYTGLKEDRAVVMRHDGTIGIEEVSSRIGNNFFGPRSALGLSYREGAATCRNGVVVIGKVMGADMPNATQPRAVPQIEFKRKSHGPEIVRLIVGGGTDADISAEVGVSRQAASYWRRKIAA